MFPRFLFRKLSCPVAASILLTLATASGARAALLVYEGYNGYTPSASMGGVAVNGNTVGLKGNYLASGGGGITASALSLNFSDLLVNGGSIAGVSNTSSALSASIGNVGNVTGTIYSSYLYSRAAGGTATGSSQLRMNDTISSSNTAQYFFSAAQSSTSTGASGVSYDCRPSFRGRA